MIDILFQYNNIININILQFFGKYLHLLIYIFLLLYFYLINNKL